MTIDYDQLALEVAAKVYGVPLTGGAITRMKEFARRYRKALKEEMEPAAYETADGNVVPTYTRRKDIRPLYSLEDF